MEESSVANKLTMVNTMHSSIADVENYMDIAENSKSYTVLQGANMNGKPFIFCSSYQQQDVFKGSYDGGGVISAANGEIHQTNER